MDSKIVYFLVSTIIKCTTCTPPIKAINMTKNIFITLMVVWLNLPTESSATLINRGGGLIYDDILNITWLADANYANTSNYAGNTNGRMDWNEAMAWVDGLVYYDTVRNTAWSDWRLPSTRQPDFSCTIQAYGYSWGEGCAGSELGHQFYNNLGGTAGHSVSIVNTGDSDLSLFTNIYRSNYWSSTQDNFSTPNNAWFFSYWDGSQYEHAIEDKFFYAWAVRTGDVSLIPEPATLVLFFLGLAWMIWLRNPKMRVIAPSSSTVPPQTEWSQFLSAM